MLHPEGSGDKPENAGGHHPGSELIQVELPAVEQAGRDDDSEQGQAGEELRESFQRGEFSFRGYKRRVMRSALGQTLVARWLITYIIYPLKWPWFQLLVWRLVKPIVLLVAWLFVLNWGKRVR